MMRVVCRRVKSEEERDMEEDTDDDGAAVTGGTGTPDATMSGP